MHQDPLLRGNDTVSADSFLLGRCLSTKLQIEIKNDGIFDGMSRCRKLYNAENIIKITIIWWTLSLLSDNGTTKIPRNIPTETPQS